MPTAKEADLFLMAMRHHEVTPPIVFRCSEEGLQGLEDLLDRLIKSTLLLSLLPFSTFLLKKTRRKMWMTLIAHTRAIRSDRHINIVRCLEVIETKSAIYGNETLIKSGHVGMLVRMFSKTGRAKNLVARGLDQVDDESLDDTLLDLFNYALLGLMLNQGKLS